MTIDINVNIVLCYNCPINEVCSITDPISSNLIVSLRCHSIWPVKKQEIESAILTMKKITVKCPLRQLSVNAPKPKE